MAGAHVSYNDDLIDVIDARINAHARLTQVMATAVDDSTDVGVDVIFDGAAISVPVKVAGGIRCYTQDRVMVQLYGVTWVVVASYSNVMRNGWSRNMIATAGTTTSGTYVNVTGPMTMDWEKHYSDSRVYINVTISLFSTVASTNFAIGVSPGDGGSNWDMVRGFFNPANTHLAFSGQRLIGGDQGSGYSEPAAGSYTATLLWARTAGTGVLSQDVSDWFSMYIEEVY